MEDVARLFQVFDQSAERLAEDLDMTYLEALIETGENMLDGNQVRVIDGKPAKDKALELKILYESIDLASFSKEDRRKAFQMAILKGMRGQYTQANHQMTPDIVGLLMVYLMRIFIDQPKKGLHMLELGVGTGNLLATILNQLADEGLSVTADGVEIDDLLLSIAVVSMGLQEHDQVSFTLQDCLTDLFVEPADVVISDLPIGYYPNDEGAKNFETAFSEGHSYSHYLFIEQGLKYLKANGLAMFVMPSQQFQAEEAKGLIQHIQKVGHLQAVIQLPENLFTSSQAQKSILVLQKQGDQAKQVKEVLMAQAPDFKDPAAVQYFFGQINEWKQNKN